jgi:hypothetical protein
MQSLPAVEIDSDLIYAWILTLDIEIVMMMVSTSVLSKKELL